MFILTIRIVHVEEEFDFVFRCTFVEEEQTIQHLDLRYRTTVVIVEHVKETICKKHLQQDGRTKH